MNAAFYAALAIVPWVAVTLFLRGLISIEGWPVGLVGTLSRCVTVPLLAAWILATGIGWRRLLPRGKGGWLLLMGVISIFINLAWFGAAKWTTATNIGMLFRFDVLFVVFIGAILGLERIGLAQLALLPVMFVGLGLLMEIGEFDWGGHVVGDVLTVAAAFGISVNAFVIRHIMQVMDEESVALYNHVISTTGFVGLVAARDDFGQAVEMVGSPNAMLAIVVLGVLLAVSLPLYYVALRRVDVWKLRMFMLTAPVLIAVVEWPLWGIELSMYQCLGAAIILAGLAALIQIERRLAAGESAPTSCVCEPVQQQNEDETE